jgi:hypothetical protein
MDDSNLINLSESQHEWAVSLVRLVQPCIYEGITTMFKEADDLCTKAEEPEKYLMTFQNFLSRIPKWNDEIISTETKRIIEKSKCTYLEDLLTCVHITHLKILSTVRTSKTQKKVEIDIPKLNKFIHNVYINVARDLYSNIYLFNKNVQPLVFQQNRNEVMKYVKEAILNAVRDSIPIDKLLRAYLDETTDLLKEEKIKEEKIVEEVKEPEKVETPSKKGLSFSDNDFAISVDNQLETIHAPKDENRLDELATIRNIERKKMEALEEDEDKIKFSDEPVSIQLDEISLDAPAEIPISIDIEELK